MAMFLVLEFANDVDAQIYTKQNFNGPDLQAVGGSIVGAFKKPTQFCQCISMKGDKFSFSYGSTWGWWTHKCGKPTRAWASKMYHLGLNLIPKELLKTTELNLTPTHNMRSPHEWTFLNGKP